MYRSLPATERSEAVEWVPFVVNNPLVSSVHPQTSVQPISNSKECAARRRNLLPFKT